MSTNQKLAEGPMALWQVISYGDDTAAHQAVCYYRARGWPVDVDRFPERDKCEDLIYPFINGFHMAREGEGGTR